jgi:hypothetical protein
LATQSIVRAESQYDPAAVATTAASAVSYRRRA